MVPRSILVVAAVALVSLLAACMVRNPPVELAAQAAGSTARTEAHMDPTNGLETATLAGGCFWCTEAIFTELKGVKSVMPGYSGGTKPNPSYEEVCTGTTGHAETIQIVFDPKQISYHDLLVIFFTTHDPTTLNRQGADEGTQYRSAIFYHDAAQEKTAHEVIGEITHQKLWPNPIITEVTKYSNFYPAEDYHRDYFARNQDRPYCQVVIAPKIAKFREHFRAKLKKQ